MITYAVKFVYLVILAFEMGDENLSPIHYALSEKIVFLRQNQERRNIWLSIAFWPK